MCDIHQGKNEDTPMPTKTMTDEQRKAMFARLHGSGLYGSGVSSKPSPYTPSEMARASANTQEMGRAAVDRELEALYREDAARVFQGLPPLNHWADKTPRDFLIGLRELDGYTGSGMPMARYEMERELEEQYRRDANRVYSGLPPLERWDSVTVQDFMDGLRILDEARQWELAVQRSFAQ